MKYSLLYCLVVCATTDEAVRPKQYSIHILGGYNMRNIIKSTSPLKIEARILIGGIPRDCRTDGVDLVANPHSVFNEGCKVLLIVTEQFYELANRK